jgi:chemotaxis protein MotB
MAEEEEKCPKCEIGAPAWMCTFADLMSLLMCFFVLLLSFSEMDAAKYKQVAGSMEEAFGIQKDDPVMGSPQGVEMISKNFPQTPLDVQNKIMDVVSDEISAGIIDAEPGPDGVIITIKDQVAFDSGKAVLKKSFLPLLDKLGVLFTKKLEVGTVVVSGHTDNVPIRKMSKYGFDSNWNLSSARAVAVVRYWTKKYKIPSSHLIAAACADGKPIKKNNTRKNRAYNRRVEINIRAPNLPPKLFAR